MEVQPLSIPGSFVVTPKIFEDDRGAFLEWYRADKLEEVLGYSLDLKQANSSVSKRAVVRGIHFAELGPGQAKYVTCPFGAVLDFIVDIRVGSPTFGKWDSVILDDQNRKAVYLSEGLGHAFVALTENTFVNYLVSDK
ncbi:dTDP-4-dehydrorhamnose 3,5-epimerase family protein, partial [uncultured Aurantimicrobium sp.]|uniref:dTDP-4-dehydrorhamnose 3,5-epimerase family protein n=1 Tax=uncultured Aurantimicrobium sp. TaxID=1705357 RepID=UPI00260DEC04